MGAEHHRTSHRAQRHDLATTLNPLSKGPSAGAENAAATQAVRAYGSLSRPYYIASVRQ
jgi:hypothetical protein